MTALPGAVLLLAGNATRFGGGKLMYLMDGKPLMQRTLFALDTPLLRRRVAVVQHEEVAALAQAAGFVTVENLTPERGVGLSVALGLEKLLAQSPDIPGALFSVGDQPYLTKDSVERLILAWQAQPERIVALGFDGRRGNPVIFPRRYYKELLCLTGDRGGSAVISGHPEALLLVQAGAKRELKDIDAMEDFTEEDG